MRDLCDLPVSARYRKSSLEPERYQNKKKQKIELKKKAYEDTLAKIDQDIRNI